MAMSLQVNAADLAKTSLRKAHGVELGPWHVIGPFKDTHFGIVTTSLAFPFAPEADALKNGGEPLLGKEYKAPKVPSYRDLNRRWEKKELTDGYSNFLPRGPVPSRNETVYLYRKISTAKAQKHTIILFEADFSRIWIDGKEVAAKRRAGLVKFAKLPGRVEADIHLEAGDHHLLIKSSNRFSTHTFAFAMPPLVPDYTERGEDFQFAWHPPRMYAPKEVPLNEKLDSIPPTPAAEAYAKDMDALKKQFAGSLSTRGDAEREQAIDLFWRKQIDKLPEIVFFRVKAAKENAIAPGHDEKGDIRLWDPRKSTAPRILLGDAVVWDMNLSRDGRSVLFSGKNLPQAKGGRATSLYRLTIDSKEITQLTYGPHTDYSPCELPNGEIVFISTRADLRVICQRQSNRSLFVCNAKGENIRKLSGNIDSDHSPQVMNDGRVLFTRWDYGVEKNVFNRHALWTMRPDGTDLQLFFGNAIMTPNAFWKARAIPGRPEVVCVFGPHHQNQAGMLGLVSNHAGPEAKRGIGFRHITTERPVQGDTSSELDYRDPFPVHERLFLAAQGSALWLVDHYGNRRLLHKPGNGLSTLHPLLVRPQPQVNALPSMARNPEYAAIHNPKPETETEWERDTQNWATMMVQDVTKGLGTAVSPGEARRLLIMEQVYRQRGGKGVGGRGIIDLVSNGTSHVRRIIGSVPVEKDGSAYFKVPPLRSISFHLLDKNGKLLMRMGSDFHAIPGESRSCVGCHESRDEAAIAPLARSSLAMNRAPSIPARPGWTADGLMDYQKHIQPILDTYCVKCHSGPNTKARLNLTGDRSRYFSMSYDSLLNRELVDWHSIAGGDSGETTPKTIGSWISRLCKHIDTKEHCGKEIPLADRQRIYTWIDANVPFHSSYDYSRQSPAGRESLDAWKFDKDFDRSFVKRCVTCHQTKAFNQSMRGGWIPVHSKAWTPRALTMNSFERNDRETARYGPDQRINISNPEHSAFLLAPLSEQAGGWGLCGDGQVFADKQDPDYQIFLKDFLISKERALPGGDRTSPVTRRQ